MESLLPSCVPGGKGRERWEEKGREGREGGERGRRRGGNRREGGERGREREGGERGGREGGREMYMYYKSTLLTTANALGGHACYHSNTMT